MSPSSLIFVAVVAVWAAYLVVDTTRRREYLATARTVDRFSASMRVLQRRAVRRESAEAFEASTAPMRNSSSVVLHRNLQPSRAVTEARAAQAASKPVQAARTGGTKALADRQRAAARVRRARLMAAVTLALVLATLGTAVLAGLGALTWIVPVSGVVLSTALVVVMRRQAVLARTRARRHAERGTGAPLARRGATATTAAAATSAGAAVAVAEHEADEDTRVDVRPAARAMPVAQEYVPFDYAREVEPAIAAEAEVVARAAERDILFDQEGWQPVPVPPPTYTLKARAERPLPPPLEIEDDFIPVVEEWDEVASPYSRASGQ